MKQRSTTISLAGLATCALLLAAPIGMAAAAGAWLPAQPPSPSPQSTAAEDEAKKDEGIPVTSQLVRQKCAGCHRADDKGRLTRISYRRTTPEGWEETIKRMMSLNDVKLEPSDA